MAPRPQPEHRPLFVVVQVERTFNNQTHFCQVSSPPCPAALCCFCCCRRRRLVSSSSVFCFVVLPLLHLFLLIQLGSWFLFLFFAVFTFTWISSGFSVVSPSLSGLGWCTVGGGAQVGAVRASPVCGLHWKVNKMHAKWTWVQFSSVLGISSPKYVRQLLNYLLLSNLFWVNKFRSSNWVSVVRVVARWVLPVCHLKLSKLLINKLR